MVSDQDLLSDPAVLVALTVMVYGAAAAIGLGHDTAPVCASIVIPSGPVRSDHVIGCDPCVSTGAADVNVTPHDPLAFGMGLMIGGAMKVMVRDGRTDGALSRESNRRAVWPTVSSPRMSQPKFEAGWSSQSCTSDVRVAVGPQV